MYNLLSQVKNLAYRHNKTVKKTSISKCIKTLGEWLKCFHAHLNKRMIEKSIN